MEKFCVIIFVNMLSFAGVGDRHIRLMASLYKLVIGCDCLGATLNVYTYDCQQHIE